VMPALTPTVAEYMPLTKYVPAKFEAASSTATAEKMLPCTHDYRDACKQRERHDQPVRSSACAWR
jgi:hypothetical protein